MEHDFSSYMNKTKIDTTFHFVPIDEEQTLTIIIQLKPKKGMGYDNISQIVLQKSAKYLAKPLTCIINQSLITGIFPNKLKIAKIIPIKKKMTDMISTTTGRSPFCPRYPKYLRKLCRGDWGWLTSFAPKVRFSKNCIIFANYHSVDTF